MTVSSLAGTYERLGVAPLVNACGIYTDLGGSVLSPSIRAALEEVSTTYCSMTELLDQTGQRVAELCDAPAARIVPGASAGIALATAACMTHGRPELVEQLPATTGMPGVVVQQRVHRYKYTRCARLAGATIREVGDETGTSTAQMADALDDDVAAILHPAHLDGRDGSLRLEEVVGVAAEGHVPVITDAAYLSYPVERIPTFMRSGADSVCFSAKYFHGPNAGGFVLGREDVMDALKQVDFTRYESGDVRRFGRAYKMDRTTVVATLLALEEWLTMDHAARWADYEQRVDRMSRALADAEGVEASGCQFTLDERLIPEPVNALRLRLGERAPGVSASLALGRPSIVAVDDFAGELILCVETIDPSDDELVIGRLRDALRDTSAT